MKLLRTLLVLLAILVLLTAWGGAGATSPAPRTPPAPPAPPPTPAEPVDLAGSAQAWAYAAQLPPLKAVLLVGPIDGDYGEWTMAEKQNMDLAAAELEANGVTVHKFYTPNTDWEQIKAAAAGAHFLFYRGHGVYWSPLPNPTVGGFYLKDLFVSSDDIRQDLALAPNAIVMLYGCFTAGTSSSDEGSITSEEALRRVAQYSDPFFDVGAAGYYADWFGDAFQKFVRYLFQGMTMGQAYESFYDFNGATVERYTHPDHPDLVLWLDKDYWDNKWQYNNAFAGLPDRTLADLFLAPEMTVAPAAVTYLAEPDSAPRSFTIQVGSTGACTFDWTAAEVPDEPWLAVQPQSGTCGQPTTVTVTPAGQALGSHSAGIRILAEAAEVQNGDQTIAVTLRLVDEVYSTYLPAVVRGP